MVLWVLLVLLTPVGAGAYLGRLARRLPRRAAIALALLPPALSPVVALFTLQMIWWDAVVTLALFSCGSFFAVITQPTAKDRARVGTLSVSVCFALFVLEAFARRSGVAVAGNVTPMPGLPELEVTCGAIFDAEAMIARRTRGTAKGPVILHVGDSMLDGTGSSIESAFPSLLVGHDRVSHVNAGVRGASIDTELRVMDRWSELLHPRHVFVYVFLANDLHELDRPYACCDLGPMLAPDLSPRCPTAAWRLPLRERVRLSPAPWVVRALAKDSALAARLVPGFAVLGSGLADRGFFGARYGSLGRLAPRAFERFEAVSVAMRAHAQRSGARLTFVLLPGRQTVERYLGRVPHAIDMWETLEAGLAAQDRVRAILASADTIDAWEFMVALVRDDPAGAMFAGHTPGDYHFSAKGHARLAAYLAPLIDARVLE